MKDLDMKVEENAREEYRGYIVSGVNENGEYSVVIGIRKNVIENKTSCGCR